MGVRAGVSESASGLTFFTDSLWLSPYTYSVLGAIREKGIPVRLEEVSFERNRTLTASFQGRTFTDLIPALADSCPEARNSTKEAQGLVLSESLAILEYLEEKFPAPSYRSIYPASMEERARARMLLSWYRCGFHALRKERSTETVFYAPARAEDRLSVKAPLSIEAREEVADWIRCLRSILKPGALFLFGEWSIADSEAALMLQRMIVHGDPVDADLVRYANAIWERPSAQEFVLHSRPEFRSYY